jgi:hypothetical protein
MSLKFTSVLVAAFVGFYPALLRGDTTTPDLLSAPEGKGWKGSIEAAKQAQKDGQPAVEFNKPGQNVIWLERFDFSEGVIEFDARGKSGPPQSSFVGVAFRVIDAKTHDAVYFRPFNFRSSDPQSKSHAVQYISEPEWTWQRLRKEKTGQFEKPLDPAPDGDAWFHARIIVENKQVKVFVNGADKPSLSVPELSERTGGSIGLWCNGYGVIANLKITPKK